MPLRRGFKTEAASLATEFRTELGLAITDPFDAHAACAHLDIPVATISFLARRDEEAADHLLQVDSTCFSAGTILVGPARMIVLNDSHHPHRQKSSLAHELGHVLLEHPAGHVIDPVTGCRSWSADQEQEADWLGGCLIAPREGLQALVRNEADLARVGELLGISDQMLTYRYNITGLARQRERGRRARSHR